MNLSYRRRASYLYIQCAQLICVLVGTGYATSLIYNATHKNWILWGKAEEYFNSKNYQNALALYKQSLSTGMKYPEIYKRMADCYENLDNSNAALIWFRIYINKKPRDSSARYRFASALEKVGRFTEAKAQYAIIDKL